MASSHSDDPDISVAVLVEELRIKGVPEPEPEHDQRLLPSTSPLRSKSPLDNQNGNDNENTGTPSDFSLLTSAPDTPVSILRTPKRKSEENTTKKRKRSEKRIRFDIPEGKPVRAAKKNAKKKIREESGRVPYGC